MDARRIDEIRRANFPSARRGYDRDAVDDFLDRLASSLEAEGVQAAPVEPEGAVKREIARFGERTAGILSAAEETAAKVRADADARAVEAKEAAEELTRRARIEAAEKSKQTVEQAEKQAERIIDEAVARRRRLNQAITSLAERRDEIAAETTRLASELSAAVGRLTEFDEPVSEVPAAEESPHPPEAQAAVPDSPRPASGPAQAVPSDQPAPAAAAEDSSDELEPALEDDGPLTGEEEFESDVYDVLEDDELPRESGASRLLVDPEEDEQELITPSGTRPSPPSEPVSAGPDPTEEASLPPVDAEDEDAEDADDDVPSEPSEDATAIQDAAPKKRSPYKKS